jgi:hypothetical protein
MFAYFNVSEPEYLIIKLILRIVQILRLLANGVQLKYKGNVEELKVNLTGNRKYCI